MLWVRACQRPFQGVGENSSIKQTSPQNFPVTIMTQNPLLPRHGLLGQTPPRALETAKLFYLLARETEYGDRVAAVQRNTLPAFYTAQIGCQGLVRHQLQSDNRNETRKAKPQHWLQEWSLNSPRHPFLQEERLQLEDIQISLYAASETRVPAEKWRRDDCILLISINLNRWGLLWSTASQAKGHIKAGTKGSSDKINPYQPSVNHSITL